MEKFRLKENKLYKVCDYKNFDFETTEELVPLQGIIGQDRAISSIDFGLKMDKKGYNIFVSGEWGTGRKSYVKLITDSVSIKDGNIKDWVYVNNFKNSHKPIAICFEQGEANIFEKLMARSIFLIRKQIREVFSSREYENSRIMLINEFNKKTKKIVEQLNIVGEKYGFIFTHNENGLVSIPIKDDKTPMNEVDYGSISDEKFEQLRNNSNLLSVEAAEYFNKLRDSEENLASKIKKLDESTARKVVEFYLSGISKKIRINDKAKQYILDLVEDILENLIKFKKDEQQKKEDNPLYIYERKSEEDFFDRYKVNVFIDNTNQKTAPVIFENNPTYYNLLGELEYKNELGVIRTDFMQIKPGALHNANGGFLILQDKDLLTTPFSWKALKRSLLSGEVKIENRGEYLSIVFASTLKPEPIPLDVKVIIIGDYYTYSLLYEYDEEFRKLFRIMADFDIEMDRNEDNIKRFARFISTHCEKEGLKPFDKSAVAKVVEYSSRLAGSQNKLSSRLSKIVGILYEANTWADIYADSIITEKHLEKTLDEISNRTNKVEEKILDMFDDESILLDVDGKKVGEINGLAVIGTGQYTFGKPSKITVSSYCGKGGIINIEREAKTSGKIHDKGIMILTGYMGFKYAKDKPLALSASIVFEQLYSAIDGDSASSTELYALLSSLSDIPIKQGIAVTGSINQRGEIQPIGGVNEKIEGFYNVCKIKGLTGEQGVIIPIQNIDNLMLSEEVVKASINRKFHIYAVKNIDEGIEILTDKKAGDIDIEGTVHYLVNKKLEELAKPEKSKTVE